MINIELQNEDVILKKEKRTNDKDKNIIDDFFEQFMKICVLSQWRHQIIAKKYLKKSSGKPTDKDIFVINTKKLLSTTINVLNEHKANYLYDLFDSMLEYPKKARILHDTNYGTIELINNQTLDIKASKKLKFLSKLYFIIRINSNLKQTLIDSINRMRELKIGKIH